MHRETMLPKIIHPSWHEHLIPLFKQENTKNILEFLLSKRNWFPDKNYIFRALEIPVDRVQIVILGQDPYPKKGQAIGRAFAVLETVWKPPSLRIIEEELGREIPSDLQNWVDQGVMLLNKTLTVKAGEPNSHKSLWDEFSKQLIQIIERECEPIWFLWGKEAQSIQKDIYLKKVKEASHPVSEFYAKTNNRPPTGFLGCGHFEDTNHIIKWT